MVMRWSGSGRPSPRRLGWRGSNICGWGVAGRRMTADHLGGLLRGRGSHDGKDGDRTGEEGWVC